jgi:hypothetical protein
MLRTSLAIGVVLLSLAIIQADAAEAQDAEASIEEAEPTRQRQGFTNRRSRLGYTETTPVFAGPNSPQGEIEETDRELDPALRFPQIDAAFQPWQDRKRDANEVYGIQLSAHYSTLYQGLSDSLTGADQASGGVLRGTLKWTLTGRESGDEGALNIMVDHRHGFRDVTPADLSAEAGYIGQTGLFYNDIGLAARPDSSSAGTTRTTTRTFWAWLIPGRCFPTWRRTSTQLSPCRTRAGA